MTDEISLLEAARVSRGLTQAELSDASGVAQAVISKFEGGRLPLDDFRVELLARELRVPVALVDGSVATAPHSRQFHRKQASLPAKAANRLRADMVLAHVRVSRLLASPSAADIPRLPLGSPLEQPADRARAVRKLWGIAPGPIDNIVALLEQHGVPCLSWDVSSARVDAIASWPEDAPPVVLLGSHAPGDRLRFTVAHELGHAVMHDLPCADCEREADEFAAEFLMPRAEIKDSLRDATLPKLAELKRVWGTSIAALARRAKDVGAITDSAYRALNVELSSGGLRKNEPSPIPREHPTTIRRAIEQRIDAGQALAEVAELALIESDELRIQYLEAA
ncbi:MAG: XRE family transcriptional regulator [Microbacterium sp.]|nr:XRE family transcriptional regulator [Microbacterium sp.]